MSKIKADKISLVSKEGEEYDFITEEGKINIETLQKAFDCIIEDAVKCNKNNGASGRRFRCNTQALGKIFLNLRKVTPDKSY